MNIGNAIKVCRVQKGYSKTKLAELTGFALSYISLIENNLRDPRLSTLVKIVESLDIPFAMLMLLASSKDELKEMPNSLYLQLSVLIMNKLFKDNNLESINNK